MPASNTLRPPPRPPRHNRYVIALMMPSKSGRNVARLFFLFNCINTFTVNVIIYSGKYNLVFSKFSDLFMLYFFTPPLEDVRWRDVTSSVASCKRGNTVKWCHGLKARTLAELIGHFIYVEKKPGVRFRDRSVVGALPPPLHHSTCSLPPFSLLSPHINTQKLVLGTRMEEDLPPYLPNWKLWNGSNVEIRSRSWRTHTQRHRSRRP